MKRPMCLVSPLQVCSALSTSVMYKCTCTSFSLPLPLLLLPFLPHPLSLSPLSHTLSFSHTSTFHSLHPQHVPHTPSPVSTFLSTFRMYRSLKPHDTLMSQLLSLPAKTYHLDFTGITLILSSVLFYLQFQCVLYY